MNAKPPNVFPCVLVNIILALLLLYPFLHLIAAYWAYWDMGVNPGANSLVLLYLYAPVMLVALTTTAIVLPLLLAKIGRATKKTMWSVSILSVLVVFGAAFLIEAWGTAGNRFDDQGVADFLANYFGRLMAGDFEPLRRRAG